MSEEDLMLRGMNPDKQCFKSISLDLNEIVEQYTINIAVYFLSKV